jgi:putative endonuclease
MARGGWVYIMADRYRGTLYIGVTSDLAARVWAHREGRGSKFCTRYGLTRLVYAEQAPTIHEAIAREKAVKRWNRAWKIELIEQANPDWDDLFEMINA